LFGHKLIGISSERCHHRGFSSTCNSPSGIFKNSHWRWWPHDTVWLSSCITNVTGDIRDVTIQMSLPGSAEEE